VTTGWLPASLHSAANHSRPSAESLTRGRISSRANHSRVDDSGAIEVVTTSLEDEGYRVLSAANGRHGLEKLAEGQVDLAVIDFMMPLLDGAALGRAMKADPALRKFPSS